MEYKDATTVLSDPLSYTSNTQRKMLRRCRAVILASGSTVVRVFYPEQNEIRYADAQLRKISVFEKRAKKFSAASAAQIIKWTRRVTRKVAVISALCEKPGIPPKVRAMLYGKKQELVHLLLSLRTDAVNRWPGATA
jgi:hypothetical protein